jgi:hypothetical protein
MVKMLDNQNIEENIMLLTKNEKRQLDDVLKIINNLKII